MIDESVPHLSREERIKTKMKEVETHVEVEKLKKDVDTHLTPEEIRAKLGIISKKRAELESVLKVSDSDEFQTLKLDLDNAVDEMKEQLAKKAPALTEKFKVDTKYKDKIRELEAQIKSLKEKHKYDLQEFDLTIAQVNKVYPEIENRAREKANLIIAFCRTNDIDPRPHLVEFFKFRKPEIKSKRLTKPTSSYPDSWFMEGISKTWRQWKEFLLERGFRIAIDRTKTESNKVVSGPEAKLKLKDCMVIIVK